MCVVAVPAHEVGDRPVAHAIDQVAERPAGDQRERGAPQPLLRPRARRRDRRARSARPRRSREHVHGSRRAGRASSRTRRPGSRELPVPVAGDHRLGDRACGAARPAPRLLVDAWSDSPTTHVMTDREEHHSDPGAHASRTTGARRAAIPLGFEVFDQARALRLALALRRAFFFAFSRFPSFWMSMNIRPTPTTSTTSATLNTGHSMTLVVPRARSR